MIKKLDYYVGSFVSFLLTHKITPALFEGSDNSKIVTFDTDNRIKKSEHDEALKTCI